LLCHSCRFSLSCVRSQSPKDMLSRHVLEHR
jgi:hypothetical protein